jgi:hypothetical protein
MAHVIEARGIRTLVVGTVLDIMSKVRPPRAVFVAHPVGRTFVHRMTRSQRSGSDGGAERATKFTTPNEIRDVHCQWQSDGSRGWEVEVRAEILRDR